MVSEHRKLSNYKIFCYLNNRKLIEKDSYIFSIRKLEIYSGVPVYTIQHLLNLRRLMTDENSYKVSEILKNKFGYNPKKRLTKEELVKKEIYNLFK